MTLLIFRQVGQRSVSKVKPILYMLGKGGISVLQTSIYFFQGQGSKVKVTYGRVLLYLLNVIQFKLFELGQSNLVHILLVTRKWHSLYFKTRGERSVLQVEQFELGLSTLVDYWLGQEDDAYNRKRTKPIVFQGQGLKVTCKNILPLGVFCNVVAALVSSTGRDQSSLCDTPLSVCPSVRPAVRLSVWPSVRL